MQSFDTAFRIYYEDTDAGGIVYYANYLKFAERARTELLRSLGFENKSLMDQDGILFVVRRIEADYHASARLDDMVTVRTGAIQIKNSSFTMKQEFYCGGTLLCSLLVQLVCVNLQKRPVRVPENLRQALAAWT